MNPGGEAVTETFEFGAGVDTTPEWCKNETQLTWKQRKARGQKHRPTPTGLGSSTLSP